MDFNVDDYTNELKRILEHEKTAQREKYGLQKDGQNLKILKKSGLALHPLSIKKKTFLPDETPEIHFQLLFGGASNLFKSGTVVRCFHDKNFVDAQVIELADQSISIALRSEYVPDWIEERGLGLVLIPDEHTFDLMEEAINALKLSADSTLKGHCALLSRNIVAGQTLNSFYQNDLLNESQNNAIRSILVREGIQIVHGPPGTGKTTTLTHAIKSLVNSGNRIVVAAPSNTAVDHCAKALVKMGIKILRVGNHIKIDDSILNFTTEGYLNKSQEQKLIKNYQKRIEELRRKVGQYKRVFDKSAREERDACYREIKDLRIEIKALRRFAIQNVKNQCDVILGTPVGLRDDLGVNFQADYLFIDEAGQCHDALAWLLASYSKNWILAGDIHQLPPTYLSSINMKNSLATSILHNLQNWISTVHFLDVQYRMEPRIATFSNRYFYGNQLQHFKALVESPALLFYDTAGMGKEEQQMEETGSKFNDGEVELIEEFLQKTENQEVNWVIISPYQAQVDLLKSKFGATFRVSTIDSFQGQEAEGVLLSLVRSNENQEIGFLRDYRRMNVAMTRAQDFLVIFGDSATIGLDPFFAEFLNYCEETSAYRSGFELAQ
jgi:predicted DNA helicase